MVRSLGAVKHSKREGVPFCTILLLYVPVNSYVHVRTLPSFYRMSTILMYEQFENTYDHNPYL